MKKLKAIIFIIIIITISLINFGIDTKVWFLEWYKPNDADFEQRILDKIQSNWYPAGLSFTGLEFAILWLRNEIITSIIHYPFSNTYNDFVFTSIPDTTQGIKELFPAYINDGLFPACITYFQKEFYVLFLQPDKKMALKSFTINPLVAPENNQIQDFFKAQIKKKYLPTSYGFFSNTYIFMSLKHDTTYDFSKFSYSIEWIAMQYKNLDAFINKSIKEKKYITDIEIQEKSIGFMTIQQSQ